MPERWSYRRPSCFKSSSVADTMASTCRVYTHSAPDVDGPELGPQVVDEVDMCTNLVTLLLTVL